MKLWYQSMSRQAEWGGYPAVLRAILDKVKDPDTEIHVAGITQIGGVGDQFRYLEYLDPVRFLRTCIVRCARDWMASACCGGNSRIAISVPPSLMMRSSIRRISRAISS